MSNSSQKKYSGAIAFTSLKYLEILITSGTAFFLARKIGSTEMGKAVPLLLYITYSNYLTLGIHQVVLKNYSRLKSDESRKKLLGINTQYVLLIMLLNFAIGSFFIEKTYLLPIVFISNGIILRSLYSSYFRSVNKILILNKNNLIFSILLFSSVLVIVSDLFEYVLYWSIAIWISLLFYINDGFYFFKRIYKDLFKIPRKEDVKFNLTEGIKLSIIGFINTILLTSDRLILNRLDFELSEKGVYQLADYFGMAIYMLFTTVFFYFYPKLISRIRQDKKFQQLIIKRLKITVFIVIPLFIVFFYFAVLLLKVLFFPEFKQLEIYASFNVLNKLLIIVFSIVGTIYISLDKEQLYMKSLIGFIAIYSLTSFLLIFYSVDQIIFIPLLLSSIIFIEINRKLFFSRQLNIRN